MILFAEIIILLVIITLADIGGLKKHSLTGLHNLPKAIQERVRELPEYSGRVNGPILTTKQRIVKKLPALVIVAAAFAGLTYLAGARDFLHGFLYSFIISASVKLYVTLILQCIVLVNSPKLWLPGTEDMKSEWTNRKFYMSSIPRSLFAFGLVSLIIGAIISVICR